MPTPQATPAQIGALQATYARLRADRDPRVVLYDDASFGTNERAARVAWAARNTGSKIESFSQLSFAQAGYLLDLVNGRRSKLDTALSHEFERLCIESPADWFHSFAAYRRHSKNAWHFGGRGWGCLNFYDKCRLLEILRTRKAGQSYSE